MIDRQSSTSPWSQTMSRIHSPIPDNESMIRYTRFFFFQEAHSKY
jgi:hypothetical protein